MVKIGPDVLTLGGNNTYTGPTLVNLSSVRLLGTYATNGFTVASGASVELSPAGNTDYATTTFSGNGTLLKTGAGTARWAGGAATFALGAGAMINVQQGTFVGGSAGNENWTNNKSDLNLASGASFNTFEANVRVNALTGSGTVGTGYNAANGYSTFAVGVNGGGGTFGGVIANSVEHNVVYAGKLTKEGAGTQTLTGANTYTGGTVVSGGTLSVGNGGTTGGLAAAGAIAINANSNLTLNRSDDVSQATVLSAAPITGVGSFTKAGAGTLAVTVANTYTGGTVVNGGTLSVGNGGTTGSLAAAATIVVNAGGNLTINHSDNFAQSIYLSSSPITGAGSLTKTGAGAMFVTPANAYTGSTTITAGRLVLTGPAARLGTGPVVNNASLEYGNPFTSGLSLDNAISGTGTVNVTDNSPLTLTTDNTYTGATTVSFGRLRLAGRSASSGFAISGGKVLELTPSAATDNGTTTFTGNGTLLKTGGGTSFWGNGVATFAFGSGALIDVQAGTFVGSSSANDVWTNNKADLNVAAGATFSGVEANIRVNALTGGGTVSTGYLGAGYSTFTVGADNGSGTFAGAIVDTIGAVGRLTKAGTGTQTLTGTSTYTLGTVVGAGTLALGNGGAGGKLSSSGTVSVAAGATFTINRSDAVAQGTDFGTISGTGSFTKAGAGTLTLRVTNSYTGLTTVAAGTLRSTSFDSTFGLLNITSGVDLAAGAKLELMYSTNNPSATVRSILAAGYGLDSKFSTGRIRSSTLAAGRSIGYVDSGLTVTVRVTLAGDADLDGGMSINDFNALAANFGQAGGKAWTDGDFDYNGGVSINDFNLLAAGFGLNAPANTPMWPGLLAFAAAHNDLAAFEAVTGVPEPAGLGVVAVAAMIGSRRRRASW